MLLSARHAVYAHWNKKMRVSLTSTLYSRLCRISWEFPRFSLVFVALLGSSSYGRDHEVDESVVHQLKSLSAVSKEPQAQQLGQSEWTVVISSTKYEAGVATERSSRTSRIFRSTRARTMRFKARTRGAGA